MEIIPMLEKRLPQRRSGVGWVDTVNPTFQTTPAMNVGLLNRWL